MPTPLAFPTAEGFGATTPGGRGGTLYNVTNESDSPIVGSLRKAVEATGPRTIIFDIPCNIVCSTPLKITNPYITILGQSAPGEGVTLQGDEFRIQTHDFIIRYLRKRTGDLFEPADTWANSDCINFGIQGQPGVCHHGILDHISMSWGIDENCTIDASHDLTIQDCAIFEALNDSFHPEGPHSDALLFRSSINGSPTYNVTTLRNMIVSCNARNPQWAYCDMVDHVNNVHYNFGEASGEIEKPGLKRLNVVNNCWIPGPNSPVTPTGLQVHPDAIGTQLYAAGNYYPPFLTDPAADNWIMVRLLNGDQAPTSSGALTFKAAQRFVMPPVRTMTARQCLACVPRNAGCTKPYRDEIDERVIETFKKNTGAIIDSQADVGGFVTMASGSNPADSDGDGMPDAWETRVGLDPNDPSDANADRDGDGYTNLEEYMETRTK